MERKVKILVTVLYIAACVAVIIIAAFGAVTRFAHADGDKSDGHIEYDGAIEHIFTHELIYDTEKAFAPNNKLRNCFDKDHLTAKEFKALLGELYKNDYVLVSIDGVLSGKKPIMPRGKKPLVMSFDDMTYDTTDRGCIDKIKLVDGVVYDFTESAEPQLTRERENITILESFIQTHPDFSPFGARATLCVNGYNGIFGYRITPDCNVSEEYAESETRECKKLVSALKDLGYTFASHTYYHKYFHSMSAREIEKDCNAWDKYIKPIVGETRILCYPAGQHNADSARNDIFKAHGFNVFFCVGSSAMTETEKNSVDATYIYRKPFDGTALRLYGKLYAHLADTAAIYDKSRFRPFSYKGGYY